MNANEVRCFAELAPLYALDMLSEADCHWVEEQIVECSELAAELAEYQEVVAAIAYSAPAVRMAENLKDRLFQHIGSETPPSPTKAIASSFRPTTLPDWMRQFSTEDVTRLQKLSWRRHRVPGVKYAILRLNLLKREIVVLLQGEAGTRYPLHRHRGVEEIFMLAGDLAIDGKTYRVGDYIRSKAGSTHALQTRTGCLCFVRTVLGEEFLEEIPAVT